MNSFLNTYKWDIAFWSIQILSWGGLLFFSYMVTPDSGGYKESNFYLVSLFLGFFIGIFSTSLLRLYLRRNISLDNFGRRQLLKICAGIVFTSLVYGGLNYGMGYLKGFFDMENVKVPEIYKDFSIWVVIVNSFILVVGWTIFYMSVKIVFKLNADRLERAELDTTLRQAQLNTLKGQINPHFMFNSLNNIRGLMLEDVTKSRDMLTKLSEMLRYSLMKNDVNAIGLEEELDMVDNYIALSKIQMEERLIFNKEIAPASRSAQIPPMIVQLLVENATKHGIANLKNGGTILVRTQIVAHELLITVSNTGTLQISKNSTQLGLKNIRQRLRLLYGDKANFSLREIENQVVAQIKIPLT